MSTKHTPGPWGYDASTGGVYFADGDVEPLIAAVSQDSTSDEQADADGALIAAAPELLALLIEIDKRVIFDPTNGFDRAFAERVETAIAKAGGRSE